MEDKMVKAKRLMGRMKMAKLMIAFEAWKDWAEFESTIDEVDKVVDGTGPMFDRAPADRNAHDIKRLCGLLTKVEQYKAMDPPVLEFLASYVQLAIIWDNVELPRNGADNDSVFSVLAGGVRGVIGDRQDPQLRAFIKEAAEELINEEEDMQHQALFAGGGPVLLAPQPSNVVLQHQQLAFQHATLAVYGLDQTYESKLASTHLWHSVLDIIHRQARGPPRQSNRKSTDGRSQPGSSSRRQSSASSVFVASQQPRQTSRHPSMAGGFGGGFGAADGQPAGISRRPSMAAGAGLLEGRQSLAGGTLGAVDKRPSLAVGSLSKQVSLTTRPTRASTSNSAIGFMLAGMGPTLLDFGPGASFSGRDMDCRAEAGQVEDQNISFPTRIQGAACRNNCVTALLVVSRRVWSRAIRMQQALAVQRAVDACCRLPFLRHTPLKELYKLSKYLTEVRFTNGDAILQQGKEVNSVYFLVSGEVEVVVDVPITTDRDVLAASLAVPVDDSRAPTTSKQSPSPTGRASVLSITKSERLKQTGPMQRVVLGRRGAGVVLGDDSLREKRMAVSVIAAGPVVTLQVSQQRFAMCVDPLTLRLFHKLRLQHSATAELSEAIADVFLRKEVLDKCREALLVQTYDGVSMPSTLQQPNSDGPLPAAASKPVWWPAHHTHKHFSDFVSIDAGERTLVLNAIKDAKANAIAAEAALARSSQLAAAAAAAAAAAGGGNASRAASAAATAAAAATPATATPASPARSPIPALQPLAVAPSGGCLKGPQLPIGVTISMFKALNVPVCESVATFMQGLRAIEEQRHHELQLAHHRHQQAEYDLVKCDVAIVKKLDLTDALVKAASNRAYTDMLEAACIAVIQVAPLPGQAPVASDVLAPVLDDAIVQWSQAAHAVGLQLVRWTSHEYFLVAAMDMAGPQRPLVRTMADILLQFNHTFSNIIAQNQVPHFAFFAGFVIGSVFSSYDGGRFLTAMSGQAYTAAHKLCTAARACPSTSTIMCSDAVMQAISRTHTLQLCGSGYLLLNAVQLPFKASFDDVFGAGAIEKEPISPGNPAATLYRIQAEMSASHFGDTGAAYSLDEGPSMMPLPAGIPCNFTQVTPRNQHILTSKGRWGSAPELITVPGADQPGMPHPRYKAKHGLASACSAREASNGEHTPRSTLEPALVLTKTSRKREAMISKSAMDYRQQLLQEVRVLASSSSHAKAASAVAAAAAMAAAGYSFPQAPAMLSRAAATKPATIQSAAAQEAGHQQQQQRHASAATLDAAAMHLGDGSSAGCHSCTLTPATNRDCSTSHSHGSCNARHAAVASETVGGSWPPSRSRSPSPQQMHPGSVTSQRGCSRAELDRSHLPVSPNAHDSHPRSQSPTHPTSCPRSLTSTPTGHRNMVASNNGLVPLLDLPKHSASPGCMHQGGGSRAVSPNSRPQSRAAACQEVDAVTGMMLKTIHKQAVTAWKDLGSQKAAEEYAQQLPAGLMNISFSTAGLARIPSLARLPYLESLAASFNLLGPVTEDQIANVSPRLKVLNLSHSAITELPAQLGNLLPSLTELNVSNNQLTTLPATLTNIIKLRVLSVEHNKLTALPSNLRQLSSLEVLYANHNQLRSIPDVFNNLTALQLLQVSHNQLVALPNSLTCLRQLAGLAAARNLLTQLPPGLLQDATALLELDLAGNQLFNCPQISGLLPSSKSAHADVLTKSNTAAGDQSQGKAVAAAPLLPDAAAATTAGAVTTVADLPDASLAAKAPAAPPAPAAAESAGMASTNNTYHAWHVGQQDRDSSSCPAACDGTPAAAASPPATATTIPDPTIIPPDDAPPTAEAAMLLLSHSCSGRSSSSSEGQAADADPARHPHPPAATAATAVSLIINLPNLRVLNLSANQLSLVPHWLPSALQDLDLSHNHVEGVPEWLCTRLTLLRLLRLHNNHLDVLPRALTQLESLKMVSLEDNPVTNPENPSGQEGAGWLLDWLYGKKYRTRLQHITGNTPESTAAAKQAQQLPDAATKQGQQQAAAASMQAAGALQSFNSMSSFAGGSMSNWSRRGTQT